MQLVHASKAPEGLVGIELHAQPRVACKHSPTVAVTVDGQITVFPEMLDGHVPDRLRLEEEVALVADKADISEECTRLHSHLDQGTRTIAKKVPVGKKLNFILQELNREANTIASKCTEIEISRAAIAIKEEVEKLREQIQNIE